VKRISVVIPTYNRAARIPVAVRCALEQTRPPFEVIVVDDGSTDATEEALRPFAGRIRYIRTPNGGASAARNRGIREARGEWIAFLDSDDTWSPDKLQRQIECVERTGAEVCFCVSTDESGNPLDMLAGMDPSLEEHAERFYPPDDCRLFRFPAHPYVQSMLVARQAVEKAGAFDETLRVAEDTKLIYQLALDCGYAVVNEPLVGICRDRDEPGLSDTKDPESALTRYECYARVQAEVYPKLVALDAEAAAVVRHNKMYFISRQAEIASALGRRELAISLARSGLTVTAGWKILVRNLAIIAAYPVAEWKFANKWGCGTNGTKA
jgi:glycosyltransferase involved in cell wall biosynthesis